MLLTISFFQCPPPTLLLLFHICLELSKCSHLLHSSFRLALFSFQEHPGEFPLAKMSLINGLGFCLKSYLHFTLIWNFFLWLLYHYTFYMWVFFPCLDGCLLHSVQFSVIISSNTGSGTPPLLPDSQLVLQVLFSSKMKSVHSALSSSSITHFNLLGF